jgi:hypothetical protein
VLNGAEGEIEKSEGGGNDLNSFPSIGAENGDEGREGALLTGRGRRQRRTRWEYAEYCLVSSSMQVRVPDHRHYGGEPHAEDGDRQNLGDGDVPGVSWARKRVH